MPYLIKLLSFYLLAVTISPCKARARLSHSGLQRIPVEKRFRKYCFQMFVSFLLFYNQNLSDRWGIIDSLNQTSLHVSPGCEKKSRCMQKSISVKLFVNATKKHSNVSSQSSFKHLYRKRWNKRIFAAFLITSRCSIN